MGTGSLFDKLAFGCWLVGHDYTYVEQTYVQRCVWCGAIKWPR